jgi:hypothetical protein
MKKVARTPSPTITPHSALSGYFFSRVQAGASGSHINNIPPPQVHLFGIPNVSNNRPSSGNTFVKSGDIDMSEASNTPVTPPTTPLGENDNQRASNKSAQHDEQGAPAEDSTIEVTPKDAVRSAFLDRDDRSQLQPRRQRDRQQKSATPQPKANWVDEIVIEEDTPENHLPVGYLGTFRGSRHFVPEYPDMLPCSYRYDYKHRLLCGHWVDSSEPCGSNCRKQNHSQKPFTCPTCRDIVHGILTGSFSVVEATRLKKLREKKNDIAFVACCVEQVTRAAPQLQTGVTEAVVSFFLTNYGHTCERTDNPDPEGSDSIEGIVRDMQERYERKQHERLARENTLNTHEKRKSYEDATNRSESASMFASDDTSIRNEQSQGVDDEMQDMSSASNKKQKTKLDTHRDPIAPKTRGTKRSSPCFSSDDNASPFAFTPGNKPLHVPTTKVYTPPSPQFGEASFLSPPASVVGAIMRKRGNDMDVNDEGNVQMEGGFKKRRVEIWRAS